MKTPKPAEAGPCSLPPFPMVPGDPGANLAGPGAAGDTAGKNPGNACDFAIIPHKAMDETMKGDARIHGGPMAGRYRHGLPVLVLFLGVLGVFLLFWVYRMGEKQKLYSDHIDALMDIQVRTAIFRIRFEEAMEGAVPGSLKGTFFPLTDALQLSHALVRGGVSEYGLPLAPLERYGFRKEAEAIEAQLVGLGRIAEKVAREPINRELGPAQKKVMDKAFHEVMTDTRALEAAAEKANRINNIKSKQVLAVTVTVWAVIVAACSLGLYRLERRRRWAEMALQTAHGEMEQKVLDRTSELASANRRLLEQIGERERAEDSLRESEAGFKKLSVLFQTLLNTIPDRITLVSRDLQVLWANRCADGPLPSQSGGLPSKFCYSLRHGTSLPCGECPAVKTFETGEPASTRVAEPDGRQWDMRSIPIRNEKGATETVLVVATDVTEKVSRQAETMRAAHLASLGEISAGVAHEINNPINGIINCAQILFDKHAEAGDDRDLAARILKEGDRIGNIVQGLLAFARESKGKKRPVAVHDILSDAFALTRSQISKEGIELESALPGDLPDIVASPQQIQQVFMNVISNSRYALNQKYPAGDESKVIRIHGGRVDLGGRPHVRIVFEDRGTGIAPDLLDKVMEPFFTTKPDGKGTGLGLSISHGIVTDHGGRFAIESVEREFTRVVIDLPAKEGGHGEDIGD